MKAQKRQDSRKGEKMGIKEVQEKLDKGEKLNDDDRKEVMSEPMPGGNKDSIKDDDKAEGEAELDKLMEEKKEEVKEDALPVVKEEAKKEEAKVEPPKEEKKEPVITEDAYKRIDIELSKPEGQVNLSDFSDREKAFYFRMRREQRRAQKAEEERDTLRFEKAKEKATEQTKEEPEDPLKDRDAEDFLTVGDIKKLMQASAKKVPQGPNPEIEHYRSLYLKKCEERAKEKHEDYDAVLVLADELISGSDANMRKLQDAAMRGDDPAETAYQIIKGDPQFDNLLPIAQAKLAALGKAPVKKEEPKQEEPKKETPPAVSPEVKKVEDKLKEEKPKTSVHAGAAESGERELRAETVMVMTSAEWHKLPKDKREALLRKFGV